MFVITNRNINESRHDLEAFGSTLNPKGANELRVAEVTRTGGKWKIDVLPDRINPTMAKRVGLDAGNEPIYASRYTAHTILRRVNPGRRGIGRNILFFVHGFNNDMKSVLERAAALERVYGVEVIAFSWPANGGGARGVVDYKSDKRDARASVEAFDRCLGLMHKYLKEANDSHLQRIIAMADSRYSDNAEKRDRYIAEHGHTACPFTVNMMLHSMGNYLYKNVFKTSMSNANLLLFDNVVLAAADTNNENHVEWVDQIPARKRIFITINENDVALRASRMKMGSAQKARLGHFPYGLDSSRAVYVDFTGQPKIGNSHAYFEEGALKNSKVKRFFYDALNGNAAESSLRFDRGRNMFLFT